MASWRETVAGYSGVVAGAFIVAVGLDLLLVPNRIAPGGVSGLATVLHYALAVPVGFAMLAINVPLFVISIKLIGLRFGLRSFIGTLACSFFVDYLEPFLTPLTADLLLATVYGGLIVGVGAGITIRAGGSTGGTDLAAQILKKYTGLSVGRALLIVDGAVIVAAGFVFGPELAMWGLVGELVTVMTVDLLLEGRSIAKIAFIISARPREIAAMVLRDMDRGATALAGRGMYSGIDREVLFVIVSGPEIGTLRRIVHSLDPQAFMVITDARDVLGEGFRTSSVG